MTDMDYLRCPRCGEILLKDQPVSDERKAQLVEEQKQWGLAYSDEAINKS